MLTNIQGFLNILSLGTSQGMMPLYEAVSNSIDAVAERFGDPRRGQIDVRLLRASDLAAKGTDDVQPIVGVEVRDNGVGFTDRHFDSFKEACTRIKAHVGGKGVGRFTYLKVFDEIVVRSVYQNDGASRLRHFGFSVSNEVALLAEADAGDEPVGTVLRLTGVAPRYAAAWPRDLETLSARIVTHFLIRFASRNMPEIAVIDSDGTKLNLRDKFDRSVLPEIQELDFDVHGHHFHIQILRERGSSETHRLHLCAHGRDVLSSKLRKVLVEIPERFTDDESNAYTLKVLVTGEYLDAHLNKERTNVIFAQEQDEGLQIDPDSPTRGEFDCRLADELRKVLTSDLSRTNAEKITSITRFVETKAPEYRPLLSEKYRHRLEQQVPPGVSDDKLDEHLLRLRRGIEDEVRRDEQEVAAIIDTESFDAFKEKIEDLFDRLNDVGKAKLASYIVHRRAILDLLDHALKRRATDANYPLERVLHKMIFPMGVTSKEIFLEQQNLWVIDDRLTYHTVLTSDKKLSSIAGLETTSGKEPDIFSFFYDTPVGVSEAEVDPTGAVVIIEFKRPGRDDYKHDPAEQITSRFREIKEGNVKSIDGRPINATGLRYYGYLIADLTQSLKRAVAMTYHQAADGEGYFLTLPGGNGYVEIISYDKLLRDAKRRNRVLFDKLGLHKG